MDVPLLLLIAAPLAADASVPTIAPSARSAELELPAITLTLQDDDALELPPLVETPGLEPYGTSGTRRLRFQLMGGIDIDRSKNTMIVAGVALEHFIAEGLSLDLELNGMRFEQIGGDPVALNIGFLLRWHFVRNEDSSIFADIGGGVMVSTDDVPDHGSSFNFTPQAGVGATFDLGGDARLIAGVKIYHISNANTYTTNPGRDQIVPHVGISIPF